ncbi:hypothetical protein BH24ACT2_BH24ACT2_18420 [soil metagenome]
MTCCGGNVVGGLLVVLVVVVVVVALLVSLVLLVIGLVMRIRGHTAKGVLVTAAAFGGIAVGLPVFLAGVSAARSDPRVLELDLRGERPIIALDKESSPGSGARTSSSRHESTSNFPTAGRSRRRW